MQFNGIILTLFVTMQAGNLGVVMAGAGGNAYNEELERAPDGWMDRRIIFAKLWPILQRRSLSL